MGTRTSTSTYFKPELVTDIFNKTAGHSALARLSGQKPMPFSGTDTFVFTVDGEAAIVGEAADKPAGTATISTVTIKPIKFVYQHRVSDEFLNISEEKQLPFLAAFADGFAKKMARALDIAAMHGIDPATKADSATIVGTNYFDGLVSSTVTYDSTAPDDNIDSAVATIQGADGAVSGIAMAPAFASALGAMKNAATHEALYEQFRFGGQPERFGTLACNINNTVNFGDASGTGRALAASKDRAIIGDFANAFRWGYAENMPMEIIQYGNPDGLGDLKRSNEIVLRAEAYIGWGILDTSSFVRIVTA